MSLKLNILFNYQMVAQKASPLIGTLFPFLKTPFFHKQSITTICPLLLPTKGQPRKATTSLWKKEDHRLVRQPPIGAMPSGNPPQSITSLVMTIPQKTTVHAPSATYTKTSGNGNKNSRFRDFASMVVHAVYIPNGNTMPQYSEV